MKLIELVCPELKIQSVVVFADRAEVKRNISCHFSTGFTEIHIKNISSSLISESLRLDGSRKAKIHEVKTLEQSSMDGERDNPRQSELKRKLELARRLLNELKDQQLIVEKKVEALDSVVMKLGSANGLSLDNEGQKRLKNFFNFYEDEAMAMRKQLRKVRGRVKIAEKQEKNIKNEIDRSGSGIDSIKTAIICLEIMETGQIDLELTYQMRNVTWKPMYNIRVDIDQLQPSMKVIYSGNIQQMTGEDWTEVPLILSTARPCASGNLPELGTLEVGLYKSECDDPRIQPLKSRSTTRSELFNIECIDPDEPDSYITSKKKLKLIQSTVQGTHINAEFTITHPTTVLSQKTTSEGVKVTIGILDLKPCLLYECVPRKQLGVFLTATATNESQLPLLEGNAAVYLNNTFSTSIRMKPVSVGEHFTCSLGVDPAIKVFYKPVKKIHHQGGCFSPVLMEITEQVINVKNTRKNEILLVIKEHIPRPVDSNIKVQVLHPMGIEKKVEKTVPTEGIRMTAENNLEWTAKIPGECSNAFLVVYTVEHPNEENIVFREKK